MKHINKIFTVAVFALLLISISAQTNSVEKLNFNERAIGNLKMGITSDNPGLKKSSIYFAGKYQVEEIKEVLENQLKIEDDPNIKILIALSLFKIGDAKSMDFVENLTFSETNPKVKNMFTAIIEEFEASNSQVADLK